MPKKHVVVTGSNGQLGSEICSKISNKIDWIGISKDNLDISSYKKCFEYFYVSNPSAIVNCAAFTDVDSGQDNKFIYLANKFGALNLAHISKNLNIPLIHISTDHIFDGLKSSPYNEIDSPNPVNTYGDSKLKGEYAITENCLNSLIIRTSWLYSIYGKNFVNNITKKLKRKKSVDVVDDQIGSPTNASDLANTIKYILEEQFQTIEGNKIFHYCNNGSVSKNGFATAIRDTLNLDCEINSTTSKKFKTSAKRPFNTTLDNSKIKDYFNIEIPDWYDSLSNYLHIHNKF